MAEPDAPMWPSEVIASDAIGRLMELWGFKRNMGRVWTVLYLSDSPLTAADLRERLRLSTGSVSMTLAELGRWGVVRKVWIQGDRRDHFAAEGDLWKMVSRVFRERELTEVREAVTALQQALAALEQKSGGDPKRRSVQRERLSQLLELAKLGQRVLEVLISEARVDASALARFLLGRAR
ncbi:MAG: ArsR family transcriptional regulator [Sandaracinaceae bacterium]|nr:ArsR family transcriptional regulator [Sandaracinaceae bacterium]